MNDPEEQENTMKTLLNYPGAKWGMAKQIIAMMPPHRSYLEPFFGSGAVLFNKPPSAIETVNDIDGDVVNFFTVLREQPEELYARISTFMQFRKNRFAVNVWIGILDRM
jgi:DNA adenine methylase